MIIDRESGKTQLQQEAPGPESTQTSQSKAGTSGLKTLRAGSKMDQSEFTVASMSPGYPRYRNALIIGVVVLIFIGILSGAYLLIRDTGKTLQEFTRNPVEYVTSLIMGSEKYKVCKSFLARNEKRLAQLGLGEDLEFFLIKEEVRVINGQKTAIVTARVKGSKATRDVIFRLQKRRGDWKIQYVALELDKGEHKRIYP
ncbi:MAG: hypothetical protein JW883_05590 [Deltaproteobacteria bacterium]|nr:hypothetical protein [Deltaproteobacteria bacterium]